jgi:threonyl-tRNA synthetase
MTTTDIPVSAIPFTEPVATWLETLTWTAVDGSAYKKLSPAEQLHRVRHSAAHVLAAALQQVAPDVQLAIGPATNTGFFYDVKTSTPLKEDDLAELESKMKTIVGKAAAFEVASVPIETAVQFFTATNQSHKLDILKKLTVETVTLYRCGSFVDLCAGPHVPHTGLCSNTKLQFLAGAHWHGEETPTLTRITGTAWAKPKDLERYLTFLEASKARDHRVLGPQLDLFSFHPWGAGAFWHPKGMKFRRTLENYWRETLERYGYVEISNPILYKKELFETSGHWEHFQHNMFVFNNEEGEAEYAIKPMNCPDTMLFFRSKTRSYRELPLRIAEGQILHRNEATGAMHGLMRTRMFSQDDAHIFAKPDQIESEVSHLFKMLDEVYALFQLDYTLSLSTRPENFMGEIAVWEKAEAALTEALKATGRPFKIEAGEGAFYGPKIDIQIRDSLGRQWQCGTFQLDFQLPERFDLHYVDADGSLQRPIVIHRAIFGSFERFMGILVEHFGGAFPTWLAPIQVAVLPISEKNIEYAETVANTLKKAGFRPVIEQEDSINYRVRACETQKIPIMLVVGEREAQEQTVSVRRYHVGAKQVLSLEAFIQTLQQEVAEKAITLEIQTFADLFFQDETAPVAEAEVY